MPRKCRRRSGPDRRHALRVSPGLPSPRLSGYRGNNSCGPCETAKARVALYPTRANTSTSAAGRESQQPQTIRLDVCTLGHPFEGVVNRDGPLGTGPGIADGKESRLTSSRASAVEVVGYDRHQSIGSERFRETADFVTHAVLQAMRTVQDHNSRVRPIRVRREHLRTNVLHLAAK